MHDNAQSLHSLRWGKKKSQKSNRSQRQGTKDHPQSLFTSLAIKCTQLTYTYGHCLMQVVSMNSQSYSRWKEEPDWFSVHFTMSRARKKILTTTLHRAITTMHTTMCKTESRQNRHLSVRPFVCGVRMMSRLERPRSLFFFLLYFALLCSASLLLCRRRTFVEPSLGTGDLRAVKEKGHGGARPMGAENMWEG